MEPTLQPLNQPAPVQVPNSTPPPELPKPPRPMAGSKKRIGLFAVAGLAAFLLLVSAGFALLNTANDQTDSPGSESSKTADQAELTVDNSGAQTDSTADSTSELPDSETGGSPSSTSGSTDSSSTSGGTSGGSQPTNTSPTTNTITYNNSCYSPASVTIKNGDTVTFINNSSFSMWPASDNHPSHNIYPEFDSNGGISSGSSYSFTFTKTGSWQYHDHNKPGCTGTITVT
jgi:plastocyanin